MTAPSLAPLLERFFTQRLMQQRQASPHTISSYRDTFRLAVGPDFVVGPEAPPATLSANILQGLLREDLGFDGVIVTDALDMKAISQVVPMGDAALRASAAGADLLMLSASQLDRARRGILRPFTECGRRGHVRWSRSPCRAVSR